MDWGRAVEIAITLNMILKAMFVENTTDVKASPSHSSGATQRLLHESLLCEAGPPLAGLAVGSVEHLLTHPLAWGEQDE